jgi:hypothetical protein
MKIEEVAELYIKEREPVGAVKQDSTIWVPDESEIRPCCRRFLKKLSKVRPRVVYTHCRSAEHLAQLYGVSPRALREIIRQKKGTGHAHIR